MGHLCDYTILLNHALKVDHNFAKISHVTYVTKVFIHFKCLFRQIAS